MYIVSTKKGLICVPVDGAGSDIASGAILMPGVTEAGSTSDNYGTAILGTTAAANSIGVLVAIHDYSEVGDSETYSGTAHVWGEVDPFYPGCLVAAEYDTTDTMAIASMQSTTQVRVTSIEDHLSGGWLYVYSGTGVGQLLYIIYDDATDLFLKSAPTTALVAADSALVKIPPLFHPLLKLSSDGTKIGTDAAAGSWTARIVRNQFKYDGQEGWIDLDPGLHHNLQLDGKHPMFRSIVVPANVLTAPIA